jgi:hypothetical protein
MGKLKSVEELLATVEKLLHSRRLPIDQLTDAAASMAGRTMLLHQSPRRRVILNYGRPRIGKS